MNKDSALCRAVLKKVDSDESLLEIAVALFFVACHSELRAKRRRKRSRDDLIIALHIIRKLTFGQISKKLKLPLGAVKQAYYRRLSYLAENILPQDISDSVSERQVAEIAIAKSLQLISYLRESLSEAAYDR